MQSRLSRKSTGRSQSGRRHFNFRLTCAALAFAITLVLLIAPRAVHAQTCKVIHSFEGATGDGNLPNFLLRQNSTLYGGTCYGGGAYEGMAFRLSPLGKETVLYNFLAGYGSCPNSLFPWKGDFYGATSDGGAYGTGAFFRLDKKGNESVLYSFSGPRYANTPWLSATNGKGVFYGTTFAAGKYGWGTIFSVDTAGKEQVLYNFTGGLDGQHPQGLMRDHEGHIYGTTGYGGDPKCPQPNNACGTVFMLDAAGKLTTLYSFSGGTDGASPATTLVRDASGNLYGATASGGDSNCAPPWGCGVVFMLDTSGHERVLHPFTGGPDGAGPQGDLLLDGDDNLYGTAYLGGDTNCGIFYVKGCGVVFMLDATGKETILHTFTSSPDGAYPDLLVADAKGNFYGVTIAGGDASCTTRFFWQGCGTVFKLAP